MIAAVQSFNDAKFPDSKRELLELFGLPPKRKIMLLGEKVSEAPAVVTREAENGESFALKAAIFFRDKRQERAVNEQRIASGALPSAPPVFVEGFIPVELEYCARHKTRTVTFGNPDLPFGRIVRISAEQLRRVDERELDTILSGVTGGTEISYDFVRAAADTTCTNKSLRYCMK
jgi:hypothetical protein